MHIEITSEAERKLRDSLEQELVEWFWDESTISMDTITDLRRSKEGLVIENFQFIWMVLTQIIFSSKSLETLVMSWDISIWLMDWVQAIGQR